MFARRSHYRAVAAAMEGSFQDEIVPVTVVTRRSSILIENDEGPRAETSLEALRNLQPAFSQGKSVTAGNASQISDGAAAVVLERIRYAGTPSAISIRLLSGS